MKLKKFASPLVIAAAGLALIACSTGGATTSGKQEGSVDPVTGGFTGVTSLIDADADKRADILGTLEKFAVDSGITGIPLFENGGLAMYNPRVEKGTNNYVKGYGFGIGRYGRLTKASEGPDVPDSVKDYYQTYETSDPGTILALDEQGSQVSDLNAMIAASYFDIELTENKESYRWHGVLSSQDKPYPLDAEGKVNESLKASTSWRIYLRTGESGGVAFRNNSSDPARKAFDGRFVTLDDYLDAFKILLCGEYAFYRGNELQAQTGYSAIKGAANYYAASKRGIDSDEAKAAWEKVGIKGGHDDAKGDYIDFTLGCSTSEFYAMYALSSSLYSPINREFFNLVTDNGQNPSQYESYNGTSTFTPVDNSLSVGPFFLDAWEEDIGIKFTRNDEWYERKENANLYRIPGYYYRIYEAASNDPNAAFNQFLAGNFDSAGVPSDYVEQYENDPRTTRTIGNSVFKLNVNSCTDDLWRQLFGEDGSIVSTAASNYWDVKPWMSNDNFIRGIFYSIDRQSFAASMGRNPAMTYFADSYEIDPVNHVFYNDTKQHEKAMEDFWGTTISTYGYSQALAGEAFGRAIDELLAANEIKDGDTLKVESWWMEKSDCDQYGAPLEKYIEDAFNNSDKAKEHNLTLNVTREYGAKWNDVYYLHLMLGQFDLGFGSISGNTLDPLNFMEVLKSDNSAGFTLNWGKDTSQLGIDYDSNGDGVTEKWSFNTLWAAADHGVATYKGAEVPVTYIELGEPEINETNGLVTLELNYESAKAHFADLKAKGDAEAAGLADVPASVYDTKVTNVGIDFWDEFWASMRYDTEAEEWVVDVDDPEDEIIVNGDQEKGTATIHITNDGIDELGYYTEYYAYKYGDTVSAGLAVQGEQSIYGTIVGDYNKMKLDFYDYYIDIPEEEDSEEVSEEGSEIGSVDETGSIEVTSGFRLDF